MRTIKRFTARALACLCLASAGRGQEQDHPVSKGNDPVSKRINALFSAGGAAGLDGVYYDNRDRMHSDLGIANYPQLKPITYTKQELDRRIDWGSQRTLLPGKIVIGNSSTASPANQAGSHQRMFYVHPRGLPFLYEQYRSNALYIYPEHRDHDPGTNGPDGYGDLYPANSPYLISSQGSSGSDRVFMHAFLKTIAVFQPPTRDILVKKGLLMPTLQAIFRKTYKASDDYFSGQSHPSAFEGSLIDELAMAKLAHELTAESIPPLVRLHVVDEVEQIPDRDFFEPPQLATRGERIADSPCAIARVLRGPAMRRKLRVSAADSFDHLDRVLKFRWVVLRGDPALIDIEPGADGKQATITVGYHPRRPIAPGSALWSNRVDIGVFAEAEGSLVSAPAFVTFTTLPNEHRSYDDDGKLLEIFYAARSDALGMQPPTSARWDAFLARFDAAPDEPAKLFAAALEPDQLTAIKATAAITKEPRSRFAAAREKLDAITSAQQKLVDATNQVRVEANKAHEKSKTEDSQAALDDANAKHNAAKKAMRDGTGDAAELEAGLATLRSEIVAALRAAGTPAIVRENFQKLRADHRFFAVNEAAIRAVAAKGSANALATALRRFESVNITRSDDPPPANDRYHYQQLNLDILSDVLFPDFLKRPPGYNYADPRLTTQKHWRDLYRYDARGKIAGWTRIQDGVRSEFTADGGLIRSRKPDGSPDWVTPVRYQIDPKTKRLEAVAE